MITEKEIKAIEDAIITRTVDAFTALEDEYAEITINSEDVRPLAKKVAAQVGVDQRNRISQFSVIRNKIQELTNAIKVSDAEFTDLQPELVALQNTILSLP